MKKHYFTPTLESVRLRFGSTIAASLPVSGDTDDEARSRSYWGETLFDEDEEETEDIPIF